MSRNKVDKILNTLLQKQDNFFYITIFGLYGGFTGYKFLIVVLKMQINKNCPVTFSAKINIVDIAEFKNLKLSRLIPTKQYVDYPWSADDVVLSTEAFTDGIKDCSAGGITNGKRVFMFHLSTDALSNFDKVKKVFEKGIAELKKDGLPLNGFLTGEIPCFPQSRWLSSKIMRMFKKNGIDATIMSRQSLGGALDIYYSAENDTWTVAQKFPQRPITTVNDLKREFQYIHLSEDDDILIRGKKIPHDDLKVKFKDIFLT